MLSELFTNRESITKSMSFELIPVGRTAINIEENGVFEYEDNIAEAAEQLKILYDKFYRSLITDIIHATDVPVQDYYHAFCKRKENKDNYEECQKKVFKEFASFEQSYIEDRYEKTAHITDGTFIKSIFPNYVQTLSKDMIDKFKHLSETAKGCNSYFADYFISRKIPFSDAEHGTVAARTILENMPAYFGNILIWNTIREEIDTVDIDDSIFDFGKIYSFMDYEGIDKYNRIIGELNKRINMHNQKNNTNIKLLRNSLNHQILTEKEVKKAKSLISLNEVREIISDASNKMRDTEAVDNTILLLITALKKNDLSHIFIKGSAALSYLSNLLTGNWDTYKESMKANEISTKESYYCLAMVRDHHFGETSFSNSFERVLRDMANRYKTADKSIKELLEEETLGALSDRSNIEIIQEYFDSTAELRRLLKYFLPGELSDLDYDAVFYEELSVLTEILDDVTTAQRLVQAYYTKKPKDLSKKKRYCFGNTLLYASGWNNKHENRIHAYEQFLLEKDGIYYYGKAAAGTKGIPVSDTPFVNSYEKFSANRIANCHMALPLWIFSKEIKKMFAAGEKYVTRNDLSEPFTVTREDYEKYAKGAFRESKEALAHWIDICKEFIRLSPNFQRFCIDVTSLRPSLEYEKLDVFYNEISAQTYRMYKQYIDADVLDSMVEAGQAYLFKLNSRELYAPEQYTHNEYAKILRYILSDENLEKGMVRLNSDVEITFRKASKERKITHKKGSILVDKIDINGDRVPDTIYKELYNYYNGKTKYLGSTAAEYEPLITKREAEEDLIKDKRYTENKWFISMSYKLNPNPEKKGKLNETVREAFHVDDHPNMLTVIRGEKDLLYYTLKGKNLNESASLNVINGFDYGKRLAELSTERKEAQKNWDNSKKVAEFKNTYIGQAVSFIVKKAVNNNAIICIEDINPLFKQQRMCVDNQVYQKFEDMLVKRLACFSSYKIPMGEPGSLICPLQLASLKFAKGRQNGILFKVNNSRTAQMDEKNGFTNMFAFTNIDTDKKKREFIGKFRSIKSEDGYGISVTFNYEDFDESELARDCNKITKEWTLYLCGNRSRKSKAGYMETVDIAMLWKKLLGDEYMDGRELIEEIVTSKNSGLLRGVFDLLRLSVQSKYIAKDGQEIYISPVTGREDDRYSEHAAALLQKKCLMFTIPGKTYTTAEWVNGFTKGVEPA